MNPGIRILPLTRANGLPGGQMSGQKSEELLVLWMRNYPRRRMNHMEMWKGNGNTTTLLFSLKKLEIVHQEKRRQVKTIVMEHFNGILFHKSGPAIKQHTNHQSLIAPGQLKWMSIRLQTWAYKIRILIEVRIFLLKTESLISQGKHYICFQLPI